MTLCCWENRLGKNLNQRVIWKQQYSEATSGHHIGMFFQPQISPPYPKALSKLSLPPRGDIPHIHHHNHHHCHCLFWATRSGEGKMSKKMEDWGWKPVGKDAVRKKLVKKKEVHKMRNERWAQWINLITTERRREGERGGNEGERERAQRLLRSSPFNRILFSRYLKTTFGNWILWI
jgi:hypothetical protein